MTNVVSLRPHDRIRQDGEAVAAIYRNLGTATAERMVTRALGELALAMAGLAAQVNAAEMGDVARRLRRLRQMADNLGMVSLAAAARDVQVCLDRGDATAFAAVWARLMRIAERSLSAGAEIGDRSG
jgi:hypothetical protein